MPNIIAPDSDFKEARDRLIRSFDRSEFKPGGDADLYIKAKLVRVRVRRAPAAHEHNRVKVNFFDWIELNADQAAALGDYVREAELSQWEGES